MISTTATATTPARNTMRFPPFTATQWQELEHQALIFKYMASGIPIPPDLLFTIKRSLDSSSLSPNLILHQPPNIGWSCYQMGFGRKIDPEPGRCKRTDGKKWRCSKEAHPDSKYCERHMHRGRNRSRKPVETSTTNSTSTMYLPTGIPISSITRNANHHPTNPSNPYNLQNKSTSHQSLPSAASYSTTPLHTPSIYHHSSSSRSHTDKDYSYNHVIKEEVDSSVADSCWHLEPLTMGGSSLKQRNLSVLQNGYSYLQPNSSKEKQNRHYFVIDDHEPLQMEKNDEPQKVMHHFFDEWPKNKESWLETDDKLSKSTQLSMSMPKSSDYDFFVTHHEK